MGKIYSTPRRKWRLARWGRLLAMYDSMKTRIERASKLITNNNISHNFHLSLFDLFLTPYSVHVRSARFVIPVFSFSVSISSPHLEAGCICMYITYNEIDLIRPDTPTYHTHTLFGHVLCHHHEFPYLWFFVLH